MTTLAMPARRGFLKTSIASFGLAAVGAPALAAVSEAPLSQSSILAAARAGLANTAGRVKHTDVIGVADFSQASRSRRFHLVDLRNGKIDSLLVAHGRGSDPAHSGWLKRFSNIHGSAATSEGRYLTGDYYVGQHGRSMRLHGLDATNDQAYARAVVVHGAWYVSPQMAKRGAIGRSEGCLAVCETDLRQVLDRLGPGRLIVAARL